MRRLFAYLGFSFLLAQTAAVFFGGTVAGAAAFLCLCGACVTLLFRKKKAFLPVLAVLLSGALAFGSYSAAIGKQTKLLAPLTDQKLQVTGTLCDLPYAQNNRTYYVLSLQSVQTEAGETRMLPDNAKLRISVQNPLDLSLNDTLTGTVQLFSLSGGDGFSSEAYYRAKGVSLFGYLREYDEYTITRGAPLTLSTAPILLRKTMVDSLHRLLPEAEASLLSAAVLGERHALSQSVKAQFQVAGLSHILVVSGMHLSLLTLLFLHLAKRLRLPRRPRVLLTIAAVLGFMALTGFSYSILRSGTMLLVVLLGMLLSRRADSLNSLGLAVFLLCMANPFAAGDTGFLLSVGATLGILVLSPRLAQLGNRRAMLLSIRGEKLLRWLLNTGSVTVGGTIGTLPILLLSGREISLVSPLTNCLLLLPASCMIQLGFFTAILSLLPFLAFLTQPLALLCGLLAKFLLWVTQWISKIPFAAVPSAHGFVALWLLLSLLLLAYLLFFCKRKRSYLTGAVLSVLILCSGIFTGQLQAADTISLAVLDVGEGMSVVLQKQQTAAVIGCGGNSDTALQQYLKRQNIQSLAYLQLTTGNSREKRHAAAILSDYPIQQLLLPADTFFDQSLQRILSPETKMAYHRGKTQVLLLDDVLLECRGSYRENGILLQIAEQTIWIAPAECDPSINAWQQADLLITDGCPRKLWDGNFGTVLLSIPQEETTWTADTLPAWADAPCYATAGQGNLLAEFAGDGTVTLRRDVF